MTLKELWEGFLKQAPHASDPEAVVKMKSRGVKALLQQAYENGEAAGREKLKREQIALEELKKLGKKPDPFNGMFDGLFGKKS